MQGYSFKIIPMSLSLVSRQLRVPLICLVLALTTCFVISCNTQATQEAESATFVVRDRPVAQVNKRLFGHFLERASWGEPGPENSLQPGTRQIQPEAMALMRQMNIPIIRFPAGTDVDFIDWRDLISNVPGRAPERPVTVGHSGHEITNQFGLDEYFQLRDDLGVETILVTNFLDAVSAKVPLREAALKAAGLVAYANAPLGAVLPDAMPDWPAVRAKNGHPEPYHVEYLQIGNEVFGRKFRRRVREGTGLTEPAELSQWYLQCLQAYIDAIDAVDPTIDLIIDGVMGDDIERTILADARIRDRVKYTAFHAYAPGGVSEVTQASNTVPVSTLSASDWWQALVAMPGAIGEDGMILAFRDRIKFARSLGYKVAVTEWNWNGWGFEDLDLPSEVNWRLASGIGTAGFLHGLMRQGNEIEMACQSMLVGTSWDITSIRVDATGRRLPYFLPQGQMTLFYNNHHGSTVLAVEPQNILSYRQPFEIGWASSPRHNVAYVDLVATADEQMIYVHALNRSLDQDISITLDLAEFSHLGDVVTHYLFAERHREHQQDETPQMGEITQRSFPAGGQVIPINLPKQTVSIFAIART
jgi:alpha-N-arabinofuranosidase